MKILKLLNKKYLSITIIYLLLGFNSYSENQPVDIWNLDKEKEESSLTEITSNQENDDEKNFS